jgi:signal transduction histidine kinase
MIGYDETACRGLGVPALTPRPNADHWSTKALDEALLRMPGRHEDVLFKTASGGTLVADVHVSHPIDDLGRPTVICLITDGTERQRLQSELIDKHKELRKAFTELERQSRDLVRLNGEIGEMSAMLTRATSLATIGEITAELTHQLNNPLAAAVGAARRIDVLVSPDADEGVQKMLNLLKESLARLQTTMAELKRVYRTSRPDETRLESIDLERQVASALTLMQQRLQDLDVVVEFPESLPKIAGHPSQIQHVIVNLLDNAAQSIGESGTIHLLARQQGTRVVFLVGDSGPGIPVAYREKVFEPFYTTRVDGSGLGLAVVRRNVESNNATIEISTSRYGGAEFTIGFEVANQ